MNTKQTLGEVLAERDDLRTACQFLMSQLEHLARVHWPEDLKGADEWLAKNDAMNCARRVFNTYK